VSKPPPDPQPWLALSDVYANEVRQYHIQRGGDPESPAVNSTVRTNTELVPQRGEKLLELLATLGAVGSIEDRRVLEVGSGFGALASYLAWRGRPAQLLSLDVRADFVEMASSCAAEMKLDDRLAFTVGNMSDMSPISDASFDVVIANNAFIYLAKPGEMEAAAREFSRVLTPGGTVLFYHANKWRPREPFSKDPVVHLLPAPMARPVSRVTGWTHNHGRVRLISPPALARLMRRAGFVNVRSTTFGKQRDARWAWKHVGDYYALAAMKADAR
jgi:ubiquinone/menaquinone biosynthesis C-methylase UbiE